MTTEADDLDRLYEALMIEGKLVDGMCAGYYCRGQMYSGWWWNRNDHKDLEYKNAEGEYHRIYGPAYISTRYQIEEWYKNGERHRIGGPARTHKGSEWYYEEGKLHRLDGPAVNAKGHPKEYWINGQKLSPKEYKKEIARRKRKGLIK